MAQTNLSDKVTEKSNVDKLVENLEKLANYSYDNWKISPDLGKNVQFTGNPYDLNFDDSSWGILSLNEKNYDDSCWLRKVIELPKTFLGEPVKGTVKLLVSVDDYGYMWINGESKGYFPWDGEFVLTNDAKPGEKFIVAIKAIKTGGPLRLIGAQLDIENSQPLRQKVEDFSMSIRTGQKLLSFDTYQTNARVKVDPGIDKSKISRSEKTKLNDLLQNECTKVDVDALRNGDLPTGQEVLKHLKNH